MCGSLQGSFPKAKWIGIGIGTAAARWKSLGRPVRTSSISSRPAGAERSGAERPERSGAAARGVSGGVNEAHRRRPGVGLSRGGAERPAEAERSGRGAERKGREREEKRGEDEVREREE